MDSVDESGDTAVACAISAGQMENAEHLLNLGAPLGKTALACAVLYYDYSDESNEERLALVRFVLSQNPVLVDALRNGKTARELAVEEGYQSLVELFDSGAW